MSAVDDRTLGAAVVAWLLVASSVNRLQRANTRAMRGQTRRELDAFRHAWQRRLSDAGAIAGAGAGLVVVAYAVRRHRAQIRGAVVDAADAGVSQGDVVARDDAAET